MRLLTILPNSYFCPFCFFYIVIVLKFFSCPSPFHLFTSWFKIALIFFSFFYWWRETHKIPILWFSAPFEFLLRVRSCWILHFYPLENDDTFWNGNSFTTAYSSGLDWNKHRQVVQNAASHILTGTRMREHIKSCPFGLRYVELSYFLFVFMYSL